MSTIVVAVFNLDFYFYFFNQRERLATKNTNVLSHGTPFFSSFTFNMYSRLGILITRPHV